ncbi:MAG: sodium:proton antiporter [Clostridia bacterium]|nr:sodium:proton antiporter [Clostridia bacterium]MBR0216141.1 sodium:proton antiporter [Clostridia bacterium]
MIENAYRLLYTGVSIILGILILLCLIRAVKGPRPADRIVCINMISTQVIVLIAVLSLMLHEGYLADVSLIYAMVSFLAVVVICRIYIGTYTQHHRGDMSSLSDHKAEKEEEPHA